MVTGETFSNGVAECGPLFTVLFAPRFAVPLILTSRSSRLPAAVPRGASPLPLRGRLLPCVQGWFMPYPSGAESLRARDSRFVWLPSCASALTDGERPDEPVRWRLRSDALSSVSNAPAPGDGGSGVVSADSYRAVETPCAAYPPLVS